MAARRAALFELEELLLDEVDRANSQKEEEKE